MSKKDFVTFARMIRAQRHKAQNEKTVTVYKGQENIFVNQIEINAKMSQIDSFVSELCDIFAADNAQFNPAKFIQACEIDTESK